MFDLPEDIVFRSLKLVKKFKLLDGGRPRKPACVAMAAVIVASRGHSRFITLRKASIISNCSASSIRRYIKIMEK